MAARSAESDLDLAYRLQMEEAMAASLALEPSSSSSASPALVASQIEEYPSTISLQTPELDRFHQESRILLLKRIADRQKEGRILLLKRIADNLKVLSHDENFAREMPDAEWEDYGDKFELPMKKGDERPFRVYFKGLNSKEVVNGETVLLAGIGVAISDDRNRIVLQFSKPVVEIVNSREALEIKALIEAFNAVVGLGVKKINVYVEFRVLFMHVS